MLIQASGPFGKCRRAVAAIEFALIVPVMATLMIGAFDISKALILWEQVYNTAHSIPISASIISVNPDKTTSLTPTQAQQAMSIIFAEIPWIRDQIEHSTRSVTLTSVNFVPTTTACAQVTGQNCYIANTIWSQSYGGGGQSTGTSPFTQVTRPCGVLVQITPTATIPIGQTLLTVLRTANVTQPYPILVADVHYQYKPYFLNFVTGPIDFWATGYWPVRSIDPDPTKAPYTTLTGGTSC